jgi:hypothetical protein
MMNRRQFVCAFAASAATFACVSDDPLVSLYHVSTIWRRDAAISVIPCCRRRVPHTQVPAMVPVAACPHL